MHKSSSPFRPADNSVERYAMDVFIDEVEESGAGGGVASFLRGYVLYEGQKFAFEAIAYGRIGGQNVSPSLTKDSMNRLQEMNVDLELFSSTLQRKLVEGEMTLNIPPGTPPPESAKDSS